MLWRATRWALTRPMRAFLVLAALVCLVPAAASAQQPAEEQRTHTVKKKDTLWDLARLYLDDAFQWPEIYRINRDVVEDPHWIYPGEVLKIPGKVPVVVTLDAVAQQGTPVEPPAEPPIEQPAETVPAPARVVSVADPNGPTVFPRAGERMAGSAAPVAVDIPSTPIPVEEEPATTVRFGEFLAAPFVDKRGGPRGFGRVLERADVSPIKFSQPQDLFQLHDRVVIAPPAGSIAPEGERYISYTFGPYLEKIGQVIIPTGVFQVVRPPRRGEAAVARVVRVFGEIRPTNRLMPYDSTALAVRGRARSVPDGRWAKVQWVMTEPVMPSVQNYVVLNISSEEGVQLGDEFQLFQQRRNKEYEGGLAKPEIAIARAQVVRVTPFATTVVITGQAQPKIDQSTMARISAKMP
jgi:hypothetical protein